MSLARFPSAPLLRSWRRASTSSTVTASTPYTYQEPAACLLLHLVFFYCTD
jgi:hypothetical protein